jgi:hypothetical protein
MNSAKFFRLSLAAAILLLAFLAYRSIALAKSSTLYPSALSPFIEIWDDTVTNELPVVAYNPQFKEYMVAWSTVEGTYTTDVWARRVHADGSLDTWFNVDSSPAVQYEKPAIAYSPPQQEYLAVYTDDTISAEANLYARTFSWDGGSRSARLDIDVSAYSQDNADIAYNGLENEFLIVYQSTASSGTIDIIGRRYRLSDHTLLPPVTLASSGAGQYRADPAVAYNPARNNYFITYYFEDSVNHTDIVAGRLASFDLVNLGPEVDIISDTVLAYIEPAIAAGPDGYLVAVSSVYYIYGRMVGGDGIPIGPSTGFPLPSVPVPGYYRRPGVGYQGSSKYLVTWHLYDSSTPRETDIFAQYVDARTGSLIGPNILVDPSPNYQGYPSIACTPNGACLVAYEHNSVAYPGGDEDIRGRFVFLLHTYLPLTKK